MIEIMFLREHFMQNELKNHIRKYHQALDTNSPILAAFVKKYCTFPMYISICSVHNMSVVSFYSKLLRANRDIYEKNSSIFLA